MAGLGDSLYDARAGDETSPQRSWDIGGGVPRGREHETVVEGGRGYRGGWVEWGRAARQRPSVLLSRGQYLQRGEVELLGAEQGLAMRALEFSARAVGHPTLSSASERIPLLSQS